MSLATPTRSSSSLDRFLRHGSGSHSQTIYSKSPTKPKRLQSANLDEATGLWRCKECDYNYPNPQPHHHQRRAHKKICEGGIIKRWLSGGSVTEDTEDSRDSSNVLERETSTPETADTSTSALTLGKKDKHDGADKVRDGDLAETGDGSRVPEELDWEQLLDGKSNANGRPSGNESRTESEIQEASGEPALSEQSALGGSGENSEVQRKEELDSGSAHGKDLTPLISDPGREGVTNLSHEHSPDRSEKEDFSFFPSSRDFDSGNQEGRGTDMEDPSSLSIQNEADSLKASRSALMDGVEGDPRLPIESDDALKEGTEIAEGTKPTPLSHENGNEQADSGEGFEQRELSTTPAADVQTEQAEFLPQSEDGERNFRGEDEAQKDKTDFLLDGEGSQLPVSADANSQKVNAEVGEAGDMLTAAENSVLKGKEEEPGTAQDTTTNDQDENDHVKQSVPRVATGDGTQNESGDEASQYAALQGQSDPLKNATEEVGDLHGHETEGVNEIANTSTGLGKPSSASRNWDDWEHVVSGKDMHGEVQGPPVLQEIVEAGPLFSGDGLTSNDQSSNLEKDSADKSASPPEEAGSQLKSGRSTGNEIGFQPAGVDRILGFPDTVNKSVDKQVPDFQSSADHHSTPDHDDLELIPGLSQADGTDGDLIALLTPASQQQADQPNKLPVRLSSAETNWDDWEDVIKMGPTLNKESERVSGPEKTTPLLESQLLGVGEHQNGSESPSYADTNSVETGSIKPAGLVNGLQSPPVVNNSSAAINSGQEVGGVNQEADGLPKTREFLDSGLGRAEGGKEVDSKEDTSRLESRPAGMDKLSSTQEDSDDWEDVKKSEYVPGGSRQSSPSFEDAHDGESSSEHEYPDGRATEVDLAEGKRPWADWEDLTKSEYMQLDGSRGEKLTFKRISDPSGSLSGNPLGRKISPSFEEPDDDGSSSLNRNARLQPFEDEGSSRRWADLEDLTKSEYMLLDGPRGEKLTFKRVSDPSVSLSGKPLGRKISPSFEEPDDDGSSSLNRNGRLQPLEDERSPSFRTLKTSSPRGVVKSNYSAGSNSVPDVETTPGPLPGSSSRKSDFGDMADKQPLVTRRPLIYRGSRRDYTSEVEDMDDVTSEPQHQHLQHHHDHNQLQQEEALKYDVEKILKSQTTYELICPICGALITRKIILRKKRRLTEGDPRWKRSNEITPVADDDGNQSPRSDISSEMEDADANWNKGIRPCLGYFFGK